MSVCCSVSGEVMNGQMQNGSEAQSAELTPQMADIRFLALLSLSLSFSLFLSSSLCLKWSWDVL